MEHRLVKSSKSTNPSKDIPESSISGILSAGGHPRNISLVPQAPYSSEWSVPLALGYYPYYYPALPRVLYLDQNREDSVGANSDGGMKSSSTTETSPSPEELSAVLSVSSGVTLKSSGEKETTRNTTNSQPSFARKITNISRLDLDEATLSELKQLQDEHEAFEARKKELARINEAEKERLASLAEKERLAREEWAEAKKEKLLAEAKARRDQAAQEALEMEQELRATRAGILAITTQKKKLKFCTTNNADKSPEKKKTKKPDMEDDKIDVESVDETQNQAVSDSVSQSDQPAPNISATAQNHMESSDSELKSFVQALSPLPEQKEHLVEVIDLDGSEDTKPKSSLNRMIPCTDKTTRTPASNLKHFDPPRRRYSGRWTRRTAAYTSEEKCSDPGTQLETETSPTGHWTRNATAAAGKKKCSDLQTRSESARRTKAPIEFKWKAQMQNNQKLFMQVLRGRSTGSFANQILEPEKEEFDPEDFGRKLRFCHDKNVSDELYKLFLTPAKPNEITFQKKKEFWSRLDTGPEGDPELRKKQKPRVLKSVNHEVSAKLGSLAPNSKGSKIRKIYYYSQPRITYVIERLLQNRERIKEQKSKTLMREMTPGTLAWALVQSKLRQDDNCRRLMLCSNFSLIVEGMKTWEDVACYNARLWIEAIIIEWLCVGLKPLEGMDELVTSRNEAQGNGRLKLACQSANQRRGSNIPRYWRYLGITFKKGQKGKGLVSNTARGEKFLKRKLVNQ